MQRFVPWIKSVTSSARREHLSSHCFCSFTLLLRSAVSGLRAACSKHTTMFYTGSARTLKRSWPAKNQQLGWRCALPGKQENGKGAGRRRRRSLEDDQTILGVDKKNPSVTVQQVTGDPARGRTRFLVNNQEMTSRAEPQRISYNMQKEFWKAISRLYLLQSFVKSDINLLILRKAFF